MKTLARRLQDMRDAIVSMESTRRDSSATVELDQTRSGRLSRMDALQLQAMAKAGQSRATIELRRIEAALRRIESGDYGECRDCGEEISLGRLTANPAAGFCLVCAEQREA